MLINAIKEQQAIIDQQNRDIKAQNIRLEQLERAVLALAAGGQAKPSGDVVKSK